MFAMEYSRIEPNSTCSRPFLSPRMPTRMPPGNNPIICRLISSSPSDKTWAGVSPSAARLDLRMMENSNRSYTSTKKPSALTTTANWNRLDDFLFIG